MRRLREAVRTRRLAVAVIGLASAVGLGASTAGGSAPAGPGLDRALDGLEDVLTGPPGPDAGECPRALERLGICESHDHEDPHGDSHEDDPQHDFEPYDGDQGARGQHGHAHVHTGQPAARGGGGDHATGRTRGLTTLEQTIAGTGDPADGFQTLRLADGETRVVREELAEAEPGRAKRRRSLLYLGQTTDWQLADEESPARVELADITANPPFPNALSAAWRPQEALGPFAIEQSVRQLNEFADASPVPARRGARAAMDMVLMTGDQADNQQLNETDWVVRLLEGGPIDPNSGTDPQSCPPLLRPSGQTSDPRLYAGVQDFDDYLEGQQFYDPDEPSGPKYSDWPAYPGLMDRAQLPFVAEGLDVPSYVVLGNHDALAQGNQKAILPFELVGTGCIKAMVPVTDLTEIADVLDPTYLLGLVTSDPEQVMLVPPDSRRQYVDRAQYKELFDTGAQSDAHGFGLVDEGENEASGEAATYYAFTPKPGIRMIALETNCDGGVVGPSASGNIDDPQWRWLEDELERASERDQLIVVFGHHPIRSLTCSVSDETPPPCTVDGPFGHDLNPGCDADPRDSSPLHLGGELTELFHRFPHVITYIAGHTHENAINEFDRAGGGPGDFWGIETASLVDWPPQNRLIELMNNCDGTLSIFGTALDSAAPATAPATGADAMTLNGSDLGSISRTLAFNDPQAGFGTGEGEPVDRNVELLIEDPRRDPPRCVRRGGDGPPADPPDDEQPPGDDREPTGNTAGGDDSLPFTGLVLSALVAAALVLLVGGQLTRWLARRRAAG